jgi:ribosomal protein S18 acetylase RimI-like enzyme
MNPAVLAEVMEATWPPARTWRIGPWTIRDGAGGGQRVSATTADGDWSLDDLAMAEAAMRRLGQKLLFLIRDGDAALDTALDAHGYTIRDPVVAYAAPVTVFEAPPPMTTFPHWPPLSIAEQVWADAGTDAARISIMRHAQTPKCVILSRAADHPSGVAYVACHKNVAMLHALEVLPTFRRQGSAQNMLRAAAHWAADQGTDTLALVVTCANDTARKLYEGLGMQVVGQYHYRQRAD